MGYPPTPPPLDDHTKSNPGNPAHAGGRQPMCDPEGCATVLGAVGGGGGGAWLTQTLGVGGSGGQPPGSPIPCPVFCTSWLGGGGGFRGSQAWRWCRPMGPRSP